MSWSTKENTFCTKLVLFCFTFVEVIKKKFMGSVLGGGGTLYIYIYIVIHRQICFVLSELSSVARQARFPKLRSKPGWPKRQTKILSLSHEETNAGEGNLNAYVSHLFLFSIYPLNGYRELNSFEEPCFTLVATITSLARELYIFIFIFIFIYKV